MSSDERSRVSIKLTIFIFFCVNKTEKVETKRRKSVFGNTIIGNKKKFFYKMIHTSQDPGLSLKDTSITSNSKSRGVNVTGRRF